MALVRRHGDVLRPDSSSGANELLSLGAHAGTHIDALCHVALEGRLHGGVDATEAVRGGRFTSLGVETIAPIICRGLLLDLPASQGIDVLDPTRPVTHDDVERACRRLHLDIREGDAVLLRTGWVAHYGNPIAFLGAENGAPGPDEQAARWLSSHGIRLTGSDTIAYEWIPPGEGHARLPVHVHLLVERGIHIVELLNLEEMARDGVREFVLVAAPLRIVGATGSPLRPLAFVA
jgi:kynurenine formamidase